MCVRNNGQQLIAWRHNKSLILQGVCQFIHFGFAIRHDAVDLWKELANGRRGGEVHITLTDGQDLQPLYIGYNGSLVMSVNQNGGEVRR